MIITQENGYWIINSGVIALDENIVVSYRDDAIVQEFASEELMMAAHKEQFPDEHREQFPEE